ncbi:asparagine synthase-related protein [Sphingomonas sp. UYP23]
MTRYAILIDANPASHLEAIRRAERFGLGLIRSRPGLTIFARQDGPHISLGEHGVVFGALFTPGVPDALTNLQPETQATVLASQGRHLIHAYWGGYIAVFDTDAGVTIVRAPFGDLPCLFVSRDGLFCAASDIPTLEALGLYDRVVDYDAVARHLVAGDFRNADTCLKGVSELRGGVRLSVNAGMVRTETLWSPWKFTGKASRLNDRVEADHRLADQARYSIRLRTAAYRRPLVLLSGGLDSSALAACLHHAGRDFACLTVATANPTGDERHFARAVTDRLQCPLVERFGDLARIDLLRSTATDMPRPVARSFEQATLALAAEVSDELGCDAVLDGGGGDNVFNSLQSATPAADCLLDDAGRPHFWPLVSSIAELADTSAWQVAYRAWRRARRPDNAYRWKPDLRFLSVAAAQRASEALAHSWCVPPSGTLPGRVAHVAMLIPAQGLAEDGDPFRHRPALSPLVSQPLIETCLRIPSWFWFERGNNRAVARRAFAATLPPDIAWRRSKGTPDSFVVEIFEANRELIRRCLLDGVLAANGVIDNDALATAFDDRRPTRGHDFVRIMQLMDAEIWCRAQAD